MRFFISFILTYLIISLPDILGFTFTVQWVPGVSNWQIAWANLKMGLMEQALLKLMIALLSGLVFAYFHKMKMHRSRSGV
jgi:precorrin-2 methylase